MCKCIEKVNENLKPSNLVLEVPCRVSMGSLDLLSQRIVVKVSKLDKKKRGAVPNVFASYCPFCGEQYAD